MWSVARRSDAEHRTCKERPIVNLRQAHQCFVRTSVGARNVHGLEDFNGPIYNCLMPHFTHSVMRRPVADFYVRKPAIAGFYRGNDSLLLADNRNWSALPSRTVGSQKNLTLGTGSAAGALKNSYRPLRASVAVRKPGPSVLVAQDRPKNDTASQQLYGDEDACRHRIWPIELRLWKEAAVDY